MNAQKICFIMCANDDLYKNECISYLERLDLPDGFEREMIVVEGASSMTSGYNQAMKQSDAKYKVYLHQDVFVLNTNFIHEIVRLFENPQIGMIGMVGSLEVEQTESCGMEPGWGCCIPTACVLRTPICSGMWKGNTRAYRQWTAF